MGQNGVVMPHAIALKWIHAEGNSYLYQLIYPFSGEPIGDRAAVAFGSPLNMSLSGDHTQVATPVPIPNTAVKHLGPMIV